MMDILNTKWLNLFALSAVEIIGDFSLKEYANKGGLVNLGNGILGYIGVIVFLIRSLRGSTVLAVNNEWDGMSSLIESISAYVFLGERFECWTQYVGIVFIMFGMYLIERK